MEKFIGNDSGLAGLKRMIAPAPIIACPMYVRFRDSRCVTGGGRDWFRV